LLAGHIARQVSIGAALAMCSSGTRWLKDSHANPMS
jgi:hypothetical protein